MKRLESTLEIINLGTIKDVPLSPQYPKLCPYAEKGCQGTRDNQMFTQFCADSCNDCMVYFLTQDDPKITNFLGNKEYFDSLINMLRAVHDFPRPLTSQEASESLARTFNEGFLNSVKRGTAGGCIE